MWYDHKIPWLFIYYKPGFILGKPGRMLVLQILIANHILHSTVESILEKVLVGWHLFARLQISFSPAEKALLPLFHYHHQLSNHFKSIDYSLILRNICTHQS